MVKIIEKIKNKLLRENKRIILTFILLGLATFPKTSFAAINDNNPSNEDYSNITSAGIGISLSKKFNLISGLTDFDKSDDHIFFMPEIFYENFPDQKDKINEQFGTGINLGYSYNKFDIFASFGGLAAKFEYEIDQKIENYYRGNFYYGFGTSYNFNKYLAARINGKFYEIDFTDRNNSKLHLRNNSFSLNLAIKL